MDEILISNTADKVEMLSELELVTSSKGKLNNYSQYTLNHFVYENSATEDDLNQVFELIKRAIHRLTSYFGGRRMENT